MDAYISALMGLVGVAIGGLASFATAWMTHRSQVREKHRELEVAKREKLFSDFIAEAICRATLIGSQYRIAASSASTRAA
ncbi:hypothetical protein U8Q05_20385 [Rhizobium ruizarguesonis]|nr:hypothetical protein U8Q05_20385 [Rhizobium ruizarguesonis]